MNINIRLNKNFTTAYNRLSNEYGEEMARLNGFADSQLSYTDFIDHFVDKQTVADASIDGNANVGQKDIVTLENEMSKPHSKLLAFNKIFYEMNKQYGFQTANQWLANEWDGHFYLHDAYNSTFKSYCFAYDISELVEKGLFFIDKFNAQPPKHLVTFTDFVGEFVSWTCNRTSGAVGIPAFLVYSFYFWHKDTTEEYLGMSNRREWQRYRDQEFQRIIYKLNQPYLRGGIQSAFTNMSIYDRAYLTSLFAGKTFPDGTNILDFTEEILEYQLAFLNQVSKIRAQNMMTFPVLSMSFLRIDKVWDDEPYARICLRHNMKWMDSNLFISADITSLSNCCRLLSDVKNLGYFNSVGGTALEVGSIKVNTINLARIAYETPREEYINVLKEKTVLCCQVLEVIRSIIKRNVDKGLLPNYSKNIIKIESQYNTIGIIGIYEMIEEYGLYERDAFGYVHYTEEGVQFAEEVLRAINEIKDEFMKDKNYSINIEQIPGERAAAILKQKDQFFHPDKNYTLPLYGNQWVPLGVHTSIDEKIKLSARLDKACNGGSIAHFNVDKPIEDFDVMWDLVNKIADAGVPYFAINGRINACRHNHGFYGDTCPTCGGEVTDQYTRIVGFYVPVSTYSSERKEEFGMRDWFFIPEIA